MKYIVIETGGKQYKVSEGDIIEVERLDSKEGEEIELKKILLYVEDEECKIGQPILENITVTAKILGEVKGEKIRVGKFKAKARYRRITGHRQKLTKIQIQSITDKEIKTSKKSDPNIQDAKV